MNNLRRLKQKFKYNSLFRILHDGLVKTGLKISFFYLVEEGLNLSPDKFENKEFKDYSLEFLKEENIDQICLIPERPRKKEILINQLRNGCSCLVFKKDDGIVGYTWFNIYVCNFNAYKFSLKENEAYLFDAYVLIKFRGKNIAPFIRYKCYKELEKLGRTRLYSISETVNKQSINFKKKLNAKFVLLALYVCLFKKWTYSKALKKFNTEKRYA
jgi:hypothetical protein